MINNMINHMLNITMEPIPIGFPLRHMDVETHAIS